MQWVFAQLSGIITCFVHELTCVFIVQLFKEGIWFFFNGVTYLTAIFLEWDFKGVGVGWTKVIKHAKSKFNDVDRACVGDKDFMFTQRLNQVPKQEQG